MYSTAFRDLCRVLEDKYNLDNLDKISYALTANINCTEPPGQSSSRSRQSIGDVQGQENAIQGSAEGKDSDPGQDGPAVCLLADRNKLVSRGNNMHNLVFYLLAFYPRYSNFSTLRPPEFLDPICTIIQDNMSFQNEGAQVLSFGYFQGYSNIKRSIRHAADDLLPTKAIATAALTLLPATAARYPRARARQQ